MRGLLDVNVLIALLDTDHVSHQTAVAWFATHAKEGWASSPITQNGCVRIMSNPSYPNPLPVHAVIRRLGEACGQDVHEFWKDESSLLDPSTFDPTRIHGTRQITDIYLLGLAVRHGGRMVTFDRGIPLAAVPKAIAKNLVVL